MKRTVTPDASSDKVSYVPAAARAIQILDVIGESAVGVRLATICSRLGLAKSTTSRLCATLVAADALSRDQDGCFLLGPKVLAWSESYKRASDPIRRFLPTIDAIPDLASMTVVLAVLNNSDSVYVAMRKGNEPIVLSYEIGLRLPASCTASGKAMLSKLQDFEIEKLFEHDALPRLTSKSIATVAELFREINLVRNKGYAVDDEETAPGMLCVSSAVRSASTATQYAISVTTIKSSRSSDEVRRLVPLIKSACESLAGP
ncbi:MAG: IclR family transcriptional regulator [Herbaspirillum sp.]